MSSYDPRRRGGQPGNQNARKHGYYSNALTGSAKTNLNQASEVIGLNDEIALLRARLKSILQTDPDNFHLISEAASTLARLMRTNHKLGFNNVERIERARLKVLCELGPQFGLDTKRIIDGFLGKPAAQADDNRFPQK
jgi:hypothetical protein